MNQIILLQQQSPGFGGFQFVFLGLMIVVFWLFFIRPQAKKAKTQKTFIENLQRGDKVVTIAGIHGTINKINGGWNYFAGNKSRQLYQNSKKRYLTGTVCPVK